MKLVFKLENSKPCFYFIFSVMRLTLLIILAVILEEHQSDTQLHINLKKATKYTKHPGKSINGQTIAGRKNVSHRQCSMYCQATPGCRSFNFITLEDETVCELNGDGQGLVVDNIYADCYGR